MTGISSSSQELSPRRKIRRGLFESDTTLSGHTLPSAPNLADSQGRPRRQAGARQRRWATGHSGLLPLTATSIRHQWRLPSIRPRTDDPHALIRQKIVEGAQKQIGSGDWHFQATKGNFGRNTDKCNLFVYDMLTAAGASPGLPNGHWWKSYPPLAANWADPSFAIPGWKVLNSGESPQPGDVVGQRIQWPNGATGHVMIVGPNASFIGVGTSEKIESVAAKMIGKDEPGGLLVYRRYGP